MLLRCFYFLSGQRVSNGFADLPRILAAVVRTMLCFG